mmetsp:Transcript_71791/g.181138  ORF Transcript_71791/g.181138 Transcript_71791/m.181138 type:complete len:292 (-) Transcript_71791:531-1406(-)
MILRVALQHLDRGMQVGVWLPALGDLMTVAGGSQESPQQVPQEIVMRLAGVVLGALEDTHQAAPQLLTLHLLEAVPGEVVSAPSSVALLLANRECHRVDGPEELICIADDVQGWNFSTAAIGCCLTCRREVAILDAEGGNNAALDHGTVAPVVEARHRHSALGLAHGEDALNTDALREPRKDPMHLSASQPEDILVQGPPLVCIMNHGFCLGIVDQLTLSIRGIEAKVVPVRSLLLRLDEASQVPMAEVTSGHAVRGNDNVPQACQLPRIAHVVVRHATAAVHEEDSSCMR